MGETREYLNSLDDEEAPTDYDALAESFFNPRPKKPKARPKKKVRP